MEVDSVVIIAILSMSYITTRIVKTCFMFYVDMLMITINIFYDETLPMSFCIFVRFT